MLAQVDELGRHLAGHLVSNGARQRDAARLRQRLQARGDVDAVAIDVLAVDDDFTEIDPDPIANALAFPRTRRKLARALDFLRADDRGNDAGKFHQRAVTHQLDDAPAVRGHAGIEDAFAIRL